ncbi:MAG TPA: Gmad2 immunoglobulin-like domain-containing protein [Anaerolineales bacterium]|jgi:hypothetical protein
MDLRESIPPALTIALVMLACSGLPSLGLETPTVTAPASPTSSAPPLTVAQVLNAEYTVTTFSGEAHVDKLTDGAYNHGTDPAAADFVSVHIVAIDPGQQVVFGDLNEDGAQDAAVLLAENYGGTGVFVSVAAVLNENGQPKHAASYTIDDRPAISALSVEDGEIFLAAVVHGPNDPGCCPAMPVTRVFRLVGAQLTLVGATSQTPDGTERAITINTPLESADVTGSLQLQGSVTIAPFENTLGYSIHNRDGAELASGPISVLAADPGGPGTFDVILDLDGVPPGPVLLIIADFSAADGAVLALDSVQLNVR